MNEDQIKFNWRQPTPLMELRALIASFEGTTNNWRTAVLSTDLFALKAGEHSDQFFALLPYVEKGSW